MTIFIASGSIFVVSIANVSGFKSELMFDWNILDSGGHKGSLQKNNKGFMVCLHKSVHAFIVSICLERR